MAQQSQQFSAPDEFERLYVRPKAGRTLIVGSYITKGKPDRRARHADVLGIDMRDGPGVDMVIDAHDPAVLALGQFDHIECTSVLEHSSRPWVVAENLQRLMVPGGTIFVTTPFVWPVHEYPGDFWRMTTEAFRVLFPAVAWDKLIYGNFQLDVDVRRQKIRGIHGLNFFPRTETLGFGRLA